MAFTPIKASDGYYVSLFPMDVLSVTQTWGANTLSHRNHQTDWVGTTSQYPYYACAPMRCYGITSSGFTWTTTEPVHTPSGLKYLSLWVAHDNDTTRGYVGKTINAGDLLGRTGVRGYVTGDHLHLDVSLVQNGTVSYDHLANDVSPVEAFYITDAYRIINLTANGITLNFQKWSGGSTAGYTLTVTGGIASSNTGAEGDIVTITANVPSGYAFDYWSTDTGKISDTHASDTTFTFGKGNANVTAHFAKLFSIQVINGTASKYSGKSGEVIAIKAGSVENQVFRNWTTNSGIIGNVNSKDTTFTIGNQDAIIHAVFSYPNDFNSSDAWIPYHFIKHRNKYC